MKNKIIKITAITTLLGSLTACWTTATGQKTGMIVKFAKEGAFINTYEAELIRGGFQNGSGANGRSFHFTIENKALIPKIQDAFEHQKEVIIKYHTEAITGCMRGETNTFLDEITITK